MPDSDDEPYYLIFSALRHSTRRLLLRSLSKEKQKRFSELQTELHIDSPTLSYHLEALGELILKRDDRYSLTQIGVAATNLMGWAEETRKVRVPSIGQRAQIGISVAIALFLLVWGAFAMTWTITTVHTFSTPPYQTVAHGISATGVPVVGIATVSGGGISYVDSKPLFLVGILTVIISAGYLVLIGYPLIRPFRGRLTRSFRELWDKRPK